MAIKFNYQQTIQQAQQLEQMASDMSGKTKGKISGVKDNLSAAWTGNAGKSFVKFLSDAPQRSSCPWHWLHPGSSPLK